MMTTVLELRDLPEGTDFEGYRFGEVASSFIWVEMKPGEGPKLHEHPYAEIFIIIEGEATYTVGRETVMAHAGQVLIAPPNTPHAFVNSGTGILRQVDIHCHERFDTRWLPA